MDFIPFKFSLSQTPDGRLIRKLQEAVIVPEQAVFVEEDSSSVQAISEALLQFVALPPTREAAEELGRLVFRGMMCPQLEEAYRQNLHHADQLGLDLWLQISVEGKNLSHLPWEFAFDPERNTFLATSAKTPFSRFVPVHQPKRYGLTPASQVRILIVIADLDPAVLDQYNLSHIEADQEVEVITSALELLRTKGLLLDYEILHSPEFSQFHTTLASGYSVIHFIGHGILEKGQPKLLFTDSPRKARPIDAWALARILRERGGVHVVMLNNCFGALETPSVAFKSFASQLAGNDIPMVVANRSLLIDELAIRFAATFYRFLAEGFPVQKALNESRLAVECENPEDPEIFANAVGYVQSPTGELFDSMTVNPHWRRSRTLAQIKDQLDRKIERTREFKLKLFNRVVFSWQSTRAEALLTLGEASTAEIQPLDLYPYCTTLFSVPVLHWKLPSDAQEVILSLQKIKPYETLWEGEVTGKTKLNLDHLKELIVASCAYKWELSYRQGEQWQVRNAIFELLPSDQRDLFEEEEAILFSNTEAVNPVEKLLLRCALLNTYQMYDSAVGNLISFLEEEKNPLMRIPLLSALREIYLGMKNKFEALGLLGEADRLLDRMAGVEDALNQLYGISAREKS